jgi:hypothetical protein
MACHAWNPEWIGSIYDEVAPEERRALDAHVAGCADCRERLELVAATRQTLRASAPDVPAAPRVLVITRAPAGAWRTLALGAALAAASIAAGVLVGARWLPAPALSATPTDVARTTPAVDVTDDDLGRATAAIDRLSQRIAALETRSPAERAATGGISETQLRAELDALARRLARDRDRDVEYLLQAIAASEIRTGTWMDETRGALNYIARNQRGLTDQ